MSGEHSRDEVLVGERPRMCPSCGKLMGVARECPYCGADAGAIGTKLKALGRAATKSGEGFGTPVTVGLLVAMIGIYLASIAFGGVSERGGLMMLSPTPDSQIRLGSMLTTLVSAGEWWRIVTGNFLHWGALHLLSNAIGIYFVGRMYEEEVGSAGMFSLFMLACIGGFAFSYAAGPEIRNVAGASAGAFGLMGAFIGRRRMLDGHFRERATLVAIQFVAINFIAGLALGADNYAHFGGLAIGLVVAYVQARYPSARVFWTAVAGALLALTAVSFGFALSNDTPAVSGLEDVARCRDLAFQSIDTEGNTPNPERAERALSCLGRLPHISDEADPLLHRVQDSLKRAVNGRMSGAFAEERRGVNDLLRAVHDLDNWFDATMRKFGAR